MARRLLLVVGVVAVVAAGVLGVSGAGSIAVGAGGAQAAGEALDPAFGKGGIVLTNFETGSYPDAAARAVAVQSDGKIVAAGASGHYFALARYTTEGKLDASFGSGGKVLTGLDDYAMRQFAAVAIQADGKVVAAGYTDASGSDDFVLLRYTADGVLDTSFGSGGTVLTDIGGGSDDRANGVAVQADGKIIAAGSSDAGTGHPFALARYTAAGRLDAGFGSAGKALVDLGGNDFFGATALVIQEDGKIVVAGSSDVRDLGSTEDFALLRYTADGVPDASFGSGGTVLTDLGSRSRDFASALALQRDGKIVVAGESSGRGDNGDFALVRYATGGKPDVSFGSDGRAVSDFGVESGDTATAVAVQEDGKIVVAGWSLAPGQCADFALVRYTTAGKLDDGFGSGGKALTDFGTARSDTAEAVAIQSDGKAVAAGGSGAQCNAGGAFSLARYTE